MYRTVEEIGNSTPRQWRVMQSGLTEHMAALALRDLSGSSPSARFAECEEPGSNDTLFVHGYDGDGKIRLEPLT